MQASLFFLPVTYFPPFFLLLRNTSLVQVNPIWNGILLLGLCKATAIEASLIIS